MRTFATALVCSAIVSPGLFAGAMAGPAESAYHRGDLDKARKLYEERLHEEPGDLQTRYNLGNVLYRSKELKAAEEAYRSTLASTDAALRSRAAHNLGNARLQAGEIDGAIAAYEEALRAEPGNADTKYNLELALRMREMKPPQQQQSQDQQQDKKQKDQQDQKQGQQQQSSQKNQDQQGSQQERQDQNQSRSEEQAAKEDKEQQQQGQEQQSTAAKEKEEHGRSQPPPAPGDYTPEEAQRVLDGLAQEERDLLADRWRTLGQNLRVEKDW